MSIRKKFVAMLSSLLMIGGLLLGSSPSASAARVGCGGNNTFDITSNGVKSCWMNNPTWTDWVSLPNTTKVRMSNSFGVTLWYYLGSSGWHVHFGAGTTIWNAPAGMNIYAIDYDTLSV